MQAELGEEVLAEVDEAGERARAESREHPNGDRGPQALDPDRAMQGNGEDGAGSQ